MLSNWVSASDPVQVPVLNSAMWCCWLVEPEEEVGLGEDMAWKPREGIRTPLEEEVGTVSSRHVRLPKKEAAICIQNTGPHCDPTYGYFKLGFFWGQNLKQ